MANQNEATHHRAPPPESTRAGARPAEASVLFSEGRAASIAPEHDLYGWLVGGWSLDVIDRGPDGVEHRGTGEVHFAWVLEGRAVQDVWIVPRRAERPDGPAPLGRDRYGTTLRVFDPKSGRWRVTWINPAGGTHNELVGERRGDEIVQEGRREDGTLMRWRFTAIRADSFHWIGEASADGGTTWRVETEFFARRLSVVPLR